MSLIVYEADPRVRYDICEALNIEFPQTPLHAVDTDEPFEPPEDAHRSVLVLSIPDQFTQSDLNKLVNESGTWGTVFIVSAPKGRFIFPRNSLYVPRPFNRAVLIRAVRSALSYLPQHLS